MISCSNHIYKFSGPLSFNSLTHHRGVKYIQKIWNIELARRKNEGHVYHGFSSILSLSLRVIHWFGIKWWAFLYFRINTRHELLFTCYFIFISSDSELKYVCYTYLYYYMLIRKPHLLLSHKLTSYIRCYVIQISYLPVSQDSSCFRSIQ